MLIGNHREPLYIATDSFEARIGESDDNPWPNLTITVITLEGKGQNMSRDWSQSIGYRF